MLDRSLDWIARFGGAVLAALPSLPAIAQSTFPGPAPCDLSLQACVDSAAPGGTVLIATDGPIAESVSFEKSLTLEAAEGFQPVLDGFALISASTPASGSHFIRIAGLEIPKGRILRLAGEHRVAVGRGGRRSHRRRASDRRSSSPRTGSSRRAGRSS